MIILAGISHRTAPVEIREAAIPGEEGLLEVGRANGSSVVALSTCNRIEFYTDGEDDSAGRGYLSARGVPASAIYAKTGVAAVRHLFRVAASLDSLVLGENQILGQIASAEEKAAAAGTAGPVLSRLFTAARRLGRRVREETRIGEGAVSVASIALELARKVYASLEGRRIMLLGSGEMARAAVANLKGEGAVVSVLAHTKRARAEALAAEAGGRAVNLDEAKRGLGEVDIVLSSTACPAFVLGREDLERARKGRHTPILLIDIAVPRDIDPVVRELPGVYLFDVDGLEKIASARRKERKAEAARAEVMVDEAVGSFMRWLEGRTAKDAIIELEEKAGGARLEVWREMRSSLGNLSPEERDHLDYLTRLLVRKILHKPLEAVKAGDAVLSVEERTAALSILFDLDGRKE